MIEVGDLVQSKNTGYIGIVVGQAYPSALHDYWFVMMHDRTYTINKRRLTPLEKK